MSQSLLTVRDVAKSFTMHLRDGVVLPVVSGVGFEVNAGECVVLGGASGVGKSSLLKMIYGVYHPDDGQMIFAGKEAPISSPADARRLGIGMVFQDLRLVPALTVVENVALAVPDGLVLRNRRLAERIDEASNRFGLAVNPYARVGQLSIGERQRVEHYPIKYLGIGVICRNGGYWVKA